MPAPSMHGAYWDVDKSTDLYAEIGSFVPPQDEWRNCLWKLDKESMQWVKVE